jgi:hypothetical protein
MTPATFNDESEYVHLALEGLRDLDDDQGDQE